MRQFICQTPVFAISGGFNSFLEGMATKKNPVFSTEFLSEKMFWGFALRQSERRDSNSRLGFTAHVLSQLEKRSDNVPDRSPVNKHTFDTSGGLTRGMVSTDSAARL